MLDPIAFLSRAEPAARDGDPADALFVLAGGQERKVEAVARWRAGAAATLVVSVGRFEWRRYALLGLPGDDALGRAVEAVPYRRRHFFVVVPSGAGDAGDRRVEIVRVERGPLGTWRELRAFRRLAVERGWRSVVLLSSAIHLRRVSLLARRVFRGTGIAPTYLAVPGGRDRAGRASWPRTPRGAALIASELVKVAFYAAVLWG
ncbi:MAG: YdcF family protein [Hyphomicrobiales bacterium]